MSLYYDVFIFNTVVPARHDCRPAAEHSLPHTRLRDVQVSGGASPLASIMIGLPAETSKRQLGRWSRVDIAVEKNGYSNLDVKRIWIDSPATSRGGETNKPAIEPVAGFAGSGIF